MKCEICGGNVKVTGKTTKNYKNLDLQKIEKIKQDVKEIMDMTYQINTGVKLDPFDVRDKCSGILKDLEI